MAHPFSTDAFSSVREYLYSAGWARRSVRDGQRARAADRMLAGRSCDHALFADVLDWAALRQTCGELRCRMPAQPLRANLQSLSNCFVAKCFQNLVDRTEDSLEHLRALFYSHARRLGNQERRRMLLALVVMEDREADEEMVEEMDDYDPQDYPNRLRAPIHEPGTPHARELVGEEMVDV